MSQSRSRVTDRQHIEWICRQISQMWTHITRLISDQLMSLEDWSPPVCCCLLQNSWIHPFKTVQQEVNREFTCSLRQLAAKSSIISFDSRINCIVISSRPDKTAAKWTFSFISSIFPGRTGEFNSNSRGRGRVGDWEEEKSGSSGQKDASKGGSLLNTSNMDQEDNKNSFWTTTKISQCNFFCPAWGRASPLLLYSCSNTIQAPI